MKALHITGKNEPLAYVELPDPVAGPGEAVVRVHAAALNHRDLWIQKGLYAGLKFPIVPGSDGCGVVESVGEGVEASWVGRRVILNPGLNWGDRPEAQSAKFKILGLPDDGTLAEKVKIGAEYLAPAPEHLSDAQAAALPLAGLTAWRALFSRAGLKSGENVLVTGVGGGVALFTLQFAVAAGAKVFVTSGSDEKLRRAHLLGATGGVNYKHEKWIEELKALVPGGFHVIIDSAGGASFPKLVDLAAVGGRIAFFGATNGNPPEIDLRKMFWKQISLLGSTMGSPDEFAAMTKFVGQHGLVPVAETIYPLAQGQEAFTAMDNAAQFGKIVCLP
ncbi:MAG: zinc-binding dehydrogenase [Verrucomicrobia bacterium]|nr:zinc-binding dehydrogenase [Verrucomicrobiota bacterium]